MKEILFDGKHEVSKTELIEKMNHFIDYAEAGMRIYRTDQKEGMRIARQLRTELEAEYKNNDLKKIQDKYFEDKLFQRYRPAVHESVASITGKTSYENVFSFLYNIDDYMRYYFPKEEN